MVRSVQASFSCDVNMREPSVKAVIGGEAPEGVNLVGCGSGRPKMLGGAACKRKMYDLPANGIGQVAYRATLAIVRR
jgi:hypothetical protein